MVATVCWATAGSSACIAATTAGGNVISSLTDTGPLFGENRTYRPIHIQGAGDWPGNRERSGYDRNSPAPFRGPAGAGEAPRPGDQGRRAGHHAVAARRLPRP